VLGPRPHGPPSAIFFRDKTPLATRWMDRNWSTLLAPASLPAPRRIPAPDVTPRTFARVAPLPFRRRPAAVVRRSPPPPSPPPRVVAPPPPLASPYASSSPPSPRLVSPPSWSPSSSPPPLSPLGSYLYDKQVVRSLSVWAITGDNYQSQDASLRRRTSRSVQRRSLPGSKSSGWPIKS
jgi:hypothetical protein